MSKTSSRDDLIRRLRRRLESERRQIEDLTTRELQRLGESLSAAASAALRSIESDTAKATARMRALLMKAWLRPLVVGLSLFHRLSAAAVGRRCIGCRGASGTPEFQILDGGEHTGSHRGRPRDPGARCRRPTPGAIELLEISGERYVALPAGTPGRSGVHRCDGRPCLEAVETSEEDAS